MNNLIANAPNTSRRPNGSQGLSRQEQKPKSSPRDTEEDQQEQIFQDTDLFSDEDQGSPPVVIQKFFQSQRVQPSLLTSVSLISKGSPAISNALFEGEKIRNVPKTQNTKKSDPQVQFEPFGHMSKSKLRENNSLVKEDFASESGSESAGKKTAGAPGPKINTQQFSSKEEVIESDINPTQITPESQILIKSLILNLDEFPEQVDARRVKKMDQKTLKKLTRPNTTGRQQSSLGSHSDSAKDVSFDKKRRQETASMFQDSGPILRGILKPRSASRSRGKSLREKSGRMTRDQQGSSHKLSSARTWNRVVSFSAKKMIITFNPKNSVELKTSNPFKEHIRNQRRTENLQGVSQEPRRSVQLPRIQ